MLKKALVTSLFVKNLLSVSLCFASPWGLPRDISDKNMKVSFEVHAPWNVLDGEAQEIVGKVTLAETSDPSALRADVSAQKIEYKAGIRAAGQIVAAWLRNNPPTPGRFVITKASLGCTPESIASQVPCKGSVDGRLTIWEKDYTIDIPIEMKQGEKGFLLEGMKDIRWGEYGFGDPNSTLAKISPVIELKFSIDLGPVS